MAGWHHLIEKFTAAYEVGRAEYTVAGTVRDIAMVLRACAPPDGVKWLTELAWAAMNAAKAAKPKLSHIASPGELFALGEALMDEGRVKFEQGAWAGGKLFRDGLMIASLAARPIRLGELMALRLGYTMLRNGERWHFAVPPSATKTKHWCRGAYPDFLTPVIDYYVDHVRKHLPSRAAAHDDGWFWLGIDGPLLPTTVTSLVTKVTLKHLGKSISPHRFRDSAATGIALEMPEYIGITKSVLGHTILKTSQDHYNHAHSFTASAELAEVINELRSGRDSTEICADDE
jgi:integrase